MPRGRPPKQIPPDEELVERALARRLDRDPDDPDIAASLRANRIKRVEERDAADARRIGWAVDLYREYVNRLVRPPLDEGYRDLPHIDIPAEIEALRPERRHLFLAQHVAEWAFRYRIEHKEPAEIAESLIDGGRSPERQRELDEHFEEMVHSDDPEGVAYAESLGRLTLPRHVDPDADPPHPPDAILRQIEKYARIWELAEERYPPASHPELRR